VKTVVTSDLHIGSVYCHGELFLQFLHAIPDGHTLVLNGDTINNPARKLTPEHQQLLDQLEQACHRLTVVFVRGNHDEGFVLPEGSSIRIAEHYEINRRLYAAHGDYFYNIRGYHRWFMSTFRRLHRLRVRLGAPAVHVARYAKKWPILYNVMRRSVRLNAVQHAREHGFESVCCGHVHYAEDQTIDGIRYLNTGAWTETPTYCILVDDHDITLRQCPEHRIDPSFFASS